jgi:hypothetical protein
MNTMNEIAAPLVKTFEEYLPAPFEDVVSASVKYYGWAPLGVGEGDEGWRIMRESVTGNVTKREYAEGSMEFKFAWSQRTSYNYSR